jgi:hypothetical protein
MLPRDQKLKMDSSKFINVGDVEKAKVGNFGDVHEPEKRKSVISRNLKL